MGTSSSNYNTVSGINIRLNALDRKEIEINKELRDIQLKLNEIVPKNERVKVKKNYFDDYYKEENDLYFDDIQNYDNYKSLKEKKTSSQKINEEKSNNKENMDKIKTSSNEINKNKKKKKKSKKDLEKERFNNELKEKEIKLNKEIKENIIKQDLYEDNSLKKKKQNKIINTDLYNEQLNKKIDFESKLKEDDLKLINSKKKNPFEENEDYKILNSIKKGELEESISSSEEEPDLDFEFFERNNEPEVSFSEKSEDDDNPYFI